MGGPDKRYTTVSRDRRSHDLPGSTRESDVRASAHILATGYRFIIIIEGDKRRQLVEVPFISNVAVRDERRFNGSKHRSAAPG